MGDARDASLLGTSEVAPIQHDQGDDADDDLSSSFIAGMATHLPLDFEPAWKQAEAERDQFEEQPGRDADRILQKRSGYRAFRAMMAPGTEEPAPINRITFEILPWVALLVDADEIATLTFDEADLVRQDVTAAPYRFITRETE